MFPLTRALPSTSSAEACASWFGSFVGIAARWKSRRAGGRALRYLSGVHVRRAGAPMRAASRPWKEDVFLLPEGGFCSGAALCDNSSPEESGV
jgi:hypothetical protein